ncbi:unnamed protein product [marine sediment metagenome]|uniref:Uncharacterized protein n=1 Tax=marine sediment metagenome TaxID=412755 RepID=X1HQA1_9ZZZZ
MVLVTQQARFNKEIILEIIKSPFLIVSMLTIIEKVRKVLKIISLKKWFNSSLEDIVQENK